MYGGCGRCGSHTSSSSEIIRGALSIYDSKVDRDLLIRRLNIAATEVIPESEMREAEDYTQMDLFTDYAAIEREKEDKRKSAERERRLQTAVLSIKDRYGKNAVLRGISFTEGATVRERNLQVGGHRGGEEEDITTPSASSTRPIHSTRSTPSVSPAPSAQPNTATEGMDRNTGVDDNEDGRCSREIREVETDAEDWL